MKKTGIVVFLLLLWCGVVQAASVLVPTPPQIGARGYILIDYNSGAVLAEKNADQRMQPASLTKLMTAYVVFHELQTGHIHLNDTTIVSKKAWKTGGSRMFIEVGTKVSVEELLKGMLVSSGNDAATALSEYVGGSEDSFVSLMNDYAKKLGMTNTHYDDATGLPNDPNHYTTPRDLSKLAVALIRQFPQYYHFFAIKKFTYNHISQDNWNALLFRDPTVDGLKTGHTDSAGYCLVSSALRDNMRLISVVMGTDSENARASQSETLLNYGFHFFETHELYLAEKAIKTVRIWKGKSKHLDLGLAQPLWVTVPRGAYGKLNESVDVPAVLTAPVEKGAAVGSIKVELDGKVVVQRPLTALETVPQGGLIRRMTDAALLLWHKYRGSAGH